MRPTPILLACLLTLPVARAAAQAGDVAAIAGSVRDPQGTPLADAEVLVRNVGTGYGARTATGPAGRFAFLQLPLGGPYRVLVRRIGARAAEREVRELRLGDRVELTVTLEPATVELAAIGVTADSGERRAGRLGGSTRIEAAAIAALPTVNRNFTDLASLAPAAGAQQSLAGARWTSTDVRLDGAQARNGLRAGEYGAGPFTVSMEAIREFEVNTNVYDVTQGRQGGGVISAATRFGTNQFTGSAFAFHRDDGLGAATDFLGRPRSARSFSTTQWGGSVGGPIVRDRVHFFAALDRQDGTEPLFVAAFQTPADQVAAGVAADSLTRLAGILQERYGVPAGQQQLGRFSRSPAATTVFGRVDASLGAGRSLTVRYNYSDWNYPLSGGVDQPITLYDGRSDFASREHQALAALRTALGRGVENELKLALSHSSRDLTPVSTLPRGFVRIRSTLPDGSAGDVRVQFGGNRLAPDESRETQLQLLDVAHVQAGDVLLTFGTDNSFTHLNTWVAEAQGGLFEFNSLADLEALRPFRYSRTTPLRPGRTATSQDVLELGLYAQAEWRPTPALTVMGGIRWDGTAFLTDPAYNRRVDSLLGRRTDYAPDDWVNLQPRGQLVWQPRGGRDVVRVGGGLFMAQVPYYLGHNQLLNDGLRLADIDLRGAAVPVPDYPAYEADPSLVPGLAPGARPPAAFVNTVDPNWHAPMTWKASVAWQHRVASWLTMTVSGFLGGTWDNYYYLDRNLVAAPAFTLDAEGGRPVYVPATTIDAQGRTNNANARANPALGRVLELTSVGKAHQRSLVLEALLRPTAGSSITAAWTWNSTRDNTSFGCCLARTGGLFTPVKGDPRDLAGAWGPADTDFRHKVVVAGTVAAPFGFDVSLRYVGATGRPFSLVVNGDINGDENPANDLAFLFDPDDPNTPAAVADGMRTVLANPDNVARDYIRAHLGRIADRNAVFAPWASRLDLRLARAIGMGGGRALELSVDVFNVLNLLDRNWGGQFLLPPGISVQNPVNPRIPLLNVVGFDQATRRYVYSVNTNAGVLQKQGDPYVIQLGGRWRF